MLIGAEMPWKSLEAMMGFKIYAILINTATYFFDLVLDLIT